MTPIAHLIFAFILGSLLNIADLNINLALFSLLGVIIDFDIFHSKYHRSESVTHFPLFWVAMTPLFWVLSSPIYLLAVMSHFVLDSIDYGVNWLWPFRNKLYGLHWNSFEDITSVPFRQIISSYAKNKRMIAMEILIAIIGLVVLLSN